MTGTLPRPSDHAALDAYEAALREGTDLTVRHSADGMHAVVPVARYLGPADDVDLSLLALCAGSVLDIGCGPGRMLTALQDHGYDGLGIDIAAEAVRQTRARGACALRRSIFAALPGEGRWGTALLLDGNIGIGGDPRRLLQRTAELLRPGGRVIVELDVDPMEDRRRHMVFLDGALQPVGAPFWWSSTGEAALRVIAADLGLTVARTRVAGNRAFALLVTADRPQPAETDRRRHATSPAGRIDGFAGSPRFSRSVEPR